MPLWAAFYFMGRMMLLPIPLSPLPWCGVVLELGRIPIPLEFSGVEWSGVEGSVG